MEINRIKIVCFSPTGSSKKIAEAVACGMGTDYTVLDLTLPPARKDYQSGFTDELVIMAAPVYFGRLAATAAQLFSALKADKTPAVLLAVYGNRHYDDALVELADIALADGFVPIAAAAFVAVHSFDSPQYPIATGRPDIEDIKQAKTFGAAIAAKLKAAADLAAVGEIIIPGNRPYKKYGGFSEAPVSTAECKGCGACVRVCPKGAISIGEQVVTAKPPVCILCHACIKACPNKARVVTEQPVLDAYNRLSTALVTRRSPETFI